MLISITLPPSPVAFWLPLSGELALTLTSSESLFAHRSWNKLTSRNVAVCQQIPPSAESGAANHGTMTR